MAKLIDFQKLKIGDMWFPLRVIDGFSFIKIKQFKGGLGYETNAFWKEAGCFMAITHQEVYCPYRVFVFDIDLYSEIKGITINYGATGYYRRNGLVNWM